MIRFPLDSLDGRFIAPWSDESKKDIMTQLSALHNTYVLIKDGADVEFLKQQIHDYSLNHGFEASAVTLTEEYKEYSDETAVFTRRHIGLAVFLSAMAISSIIAVFTTNALLKRQQYGVFIAKEYHSDCVVTPALSDIDLRIEKGEFIAIMGASGSGKTTLLNIIGCMDVPTSGTYFFDGIELSREKEKSLSSIRGKRIAFVFQHFALIDDYTVFENVEVPLLKQAMSKAKRKKRVTSALRTVGITDLSRKKPTHISGGQKTACCDCKSYCLRCTSHSCG